MVYRRIQCNEAACITLSTCLVLVCSTSGDPVQWSGVMLQHLESIGPFKEASVVELLGCCFSR